MKFTFWHFLLCAIISSLDGTPANSGSEDEDYTTANQLAHAELLSKLDGQEDKKRRSRRCPSISCGTPSSQHQFGVPSRLCPGPPSSSSQPSALSAPENPSAATNKESSKAEEKRSVHFSLCELQQEKPIDGELTCSPSLLQEHHNSLQELHQQLDSLKSQEQSLLQSLQAERQKLSSEVAQRQASVQQLQTQLGTFSSSQPSLTTSAQTNNFSAFLRPENRDKQFTTADHLASVNHVPSFLQNNTSQQNSPAVPPKLSTEIQRPGFST